MVIKVKLLFATSNEINRPVPPPTIVPPGFTDPFPAYWVIQTWPSRSVMIPHMSPGTLNSLKVRLIGSNIPNLLTLDSVNHTRPFESVVMANGADSGVGISNSSTYLGKAGTVEGPMLSCRARSTQAIRKEVRRRNRKSLLGSPPFLQMRDLVVKPAVLTIVPIIVWNLSQVTSALWAYVEGASFVNDGYLNHVLLRLGFIIRFIFYVFWQH